MEDSSSTRIYVTTSVNYVQSRNVFPDKNNCVVCAAVKSQVLRSAKKKLLNYVPTLNIISWTCAYCRGYDVFKFPVKRKRVTIEAQRG